ncbi:MAG: hypothetical protein IPO43_16225 [Rhodoferax sp.]|nr:hypothetical protein [Rhodoferax sp.]
MPRTLGKPSHKPRRFRGAAGRGRAYDYYSRVVPWRQALAAAMPLGSHMYASMFDTYTGV